MKDKEKSYRGEYQVVVVSIIIGFGFVYASCLVMFSSETAWKDIYAAACSIVGGVIGGLITLEGVKRTVFAQRDLEAEKLIPHKLVKLHELTNRIDEVADEFNDITSIMPFHLRKRVESFQGVDKSQKYMDEKIDRYIAFYENLKNLEYEFIEIVSQIDINTYKAIKSVFKKFKEEYSPLANDEFDKYLTEVYFGETVDEETFIEVTDQLVERLNNFRNLMNENFKELESVINSKLEQYEKDIL
jgi:hypothetical protein